MSDEEPRNEPLHRPSVGWKIIRDAGLVVLASSAVGLLSNVVRSERLPWIQTAEYDILVPCPEPVGDATEMSADEPLLTDATSLVIDARTEAEFKAWHVPGALNVEFDWLGPPLDAEVQTVARNAAKSRAQRVVVYGDGDDPDSGQEWARLLSGARIKNVFYVKGGAPAVRKVLQPGGAP